MRRALCGPVCLFLQEVSMLQDGRIAGAACAGRTDPALCASLFAQEFSIDWLVELCNQRASQILSRLEEGLAQGWLVRTRPGFYRFSDPGARDSWASRLPEAERDELHRRIADLLLRDLADDDSKATTLAHHLIRIHNDVEGCRWLVKAGDAFLKGFQEEDALRCYTKVLEDLSGSRGEEADSVFTGAAVKYSKISTARHDTSKVLSILNEAMERAKRRSRRADMALLEMHLAKNEWLRSRYGMALRHFQRGWAMAEELDDARLWRSATTFSTFFLWWQGRFKEAVQSYERSVPEVDRYPQGRFPLLAAMTVGDCYAHVGQFTQGLGMVDSIRAHCWERGNRNLAAHATAVMGSLMLDIGHTKEALGYLESSVREAHGQQNPWILLFANQWLAYVYYLRGSNRKAVARIQEWLRLSEELQVTAQTTPYLLDLCWATEKGKFPPVEGLSLEREIHRMARSQNLFLKGVAYRYLAMLLKGKGAPHERLVEILRKSIKLLERSGHQFELAKSRFELARQYLAVAKEEEAARLARMAYDLIAPFNEALVPDDLRFLIKGPPMGENLLDEILKLGQEVVTIQENKDLVQHILSAVNRITGAERGAIFLLEQGTRPPRLVLRASKNLTPEQVFHSSFSSSMRMIEEVARSGKELISEMEAPEGSASGIEEVVRSRICVPMILRDRVVGVLYHDNRLLRSAFRESDLRLLGYFAALAAFALDNAKAYDEIRRLNMKLKEEKLYYEEQHLQSLHFEDIVGKSRAIMRVLAQVEQVAGTDTTVLIRGETGVGKELVARAIHRQSPRRDKPFIRVHCSALPESLIPSELFGHEKGAFTGATHRRIGRFELADGGTLFLDEIGDLPPDVQVRLLRVLQSKEFERVGGTETLRSDFRLVVATNRNLEEEVKSQRFRADLYYRLNVFPIYVPPLRERRDDIPVIAHYFLKIYSQKMGKKFDNISDSEMERLTRYDWPGNVRELENVMERGVILSKEPDFRVPELDLFGLGDSHAVSQRLTLRENERRCILSALEQTRWKVRGKGGAAELLDIHPSTLAFRMKKLGIKRPPAL